MPQSSELAQDVFKGAVKDYFETVISLAYTLPSALFSLSFILMH